jgi:3-hydroxy-9,10-secoandrosta-1,3,5(10)-triene-9,17-dione monooxygenase
MTSEIIQPWLDLNAGRAHVANDPATTAPATINAMLGAAPLNPFL